MAEGRGGSFVLRVEGDWGGLEPRSVKAKLQCYFQSRKRSGGGECEIQPRAGQFLVYFTQEAVRQGVLAKKSHVLELADKRKLVLMVTPHETGDGPASGLSTKDRVPEQVSPEEDHTKERAAQEVLQKGDLAATNTSGGINQWRNEDISKKPPASSLVVLEDVNEVITPEMLILLVENITCLSGDSDFQIELIRERKVAVLTFQTNIDAANFLDRCALNIRFKSFKITARPLELTQMIKVEDMPSGICKDFIALYFESHKNGGGQVTNIHVFPKENSAIVTFCDHQAVPRVLEKQHSFKNQPVLVYPYYSSLDAVLYGKERPQVKRPDPVRVPLDPYISQFIQKDHKLLKEINKEMAKHHCELTWPQMTCQHPEIVLCPSTALPRQLINSWKDDVSTQIACILSKFKTAVCKMIPVAWDTLKTKDGVVAIPDSYKATVTLVGFVLSVNDMEKTVKDHVEKVIKDEERTKQTIEETVFVTPGKYAVLHHGLLDENVCKKNPDLKLSYISSARILRLHGINTEVYKMKSLILERLQKMEQKQINLHTCIFQFLQRADSKKVSMKIFDANKINASYELAPDSVALVGCSAEVLCKAEERLKKDLDHKQVTLENQGILNKREWKDLVRDLQRKHNSSEEAVKIDDSFVSGQGDKVTIAGYTKAVADVHQALSEFVERNTLITREIPTKCGAVVKFVEKEKNEVWVGLRKKGVKIEFGPQSIILNGCKADVPDAAAEVEQLVSSTHSVSVVIDKPGVKSFFKNKEHYYIPEAKQAFGCLIRLRQDEESAGRSKEKTGHPHSKIKLKDGVVIAVFKGDLTHYPVDVVVNASNEDLKHIGGLAEALLKAAGHELQSQCDEHVRRYGRLKPGCAVITGAGNLPCKQVIHAVGPRWKYEEKEKCAFQLKKAVKETLHLAETYNYSSIAIPAISSGIFGFPLRECAHCIVTAIKEHLEESSENGCVKKICLVDVSDNTIQALSDALKEVFREGLPRPQSSSPPQKTKQPKVTEEEPHVVFSAEGLKLKLVEKGIEDAVTDVIVSSVGTDLKIGVGPLSKALLKKAGLQQQVDFDQAVQVQTAQGQQILAGWVIQTGGYNLNCQFVLHTVVPSWNGGKGNGIQVLKDLTRECLKETEALSLRSISFPAIGTGGFGFPKSEVAKLMFEEVLQFSAQNNLKSLREVHFVLHPHDVNNIKEFNEVFESRIRRNPKIVSHHDVQNPGFFGLISTPVLGIYEMQIGMVNFQVLTGDITKENTDVIVNISNVTFNAKSGVSKAILEGAGSQVEAECNLLASQPNNGFVTTQGGNLICKKIIHLIPDSDIKDQVSKVLQECELRACTSVAFPAIGTGQGGKSPENVAKEMIGAIADFACRKSPQHIKVVKVVIFQPHMQDAFYACMKKKEGSALPSSGSIFSRLKSAITSKIQPPPKKRLLVLEKKLEVTVFEICGEHKKNVEDTEAWLKRTILQEQTECHICDMLIELFDEDEIKKLNDLQRRLHIAIRLDKKESPPSIMVSGIPRDVLEAFKEIQKLIQRMKDDREEKSKAKLCENLVEWQYSPNGGDGFVCFDLLDNLHLEDAKINNTKYVEVSIQGQSFKADVTKMCATDNQGRSMRIQRMAKDEGKLLVGLPKQWEDMNGAVVKSVSLQPSAPEYQDVEKKFRATCPTQSIEKIERIQNAYLWQAYKVKKEEMDNKNGHRNNERSLFHGTPSSTITPINHTGFNRGYAGKNAAMIGNGTYFAVDAKYSAQDTYATPDSSGRKFMYLARVLTGDFSTGKRGLVTPPPKTPGGFELYDSVTDNPIYPSMFVIFHDAQAYPEYLIIFKN